ncbi:MAG: hypothetical protein Kilf2KO_12090 [Rhodospirillales bacterium]
MELIGDVAQALPQLLDGFALTALITLLAGLGALLLSVPLVAGRRSSIRSLRLAVIGYVWIFRALPIVILVFLLYFGLPAAFDLGRLSAFWVGVATLALNGAAFMSEVWRGAIATVGSGQFEAAKALGLKPLARWRRVILPQVVPVALPPLIGELTFLVKASPVLSLITLVDLTRRAQQVSMATFDPLAPMLAAALLYFLLLFSLSRLGQRLERRLKAPGRAA